MDTQNPNSICILILLSNSLSQKLSDDIEGDSINIRSELKIIENK